jgi:hypothetical protein
MTMPAASNRASTFIALLHAATPKRANGLRAEVWSVTVDTTATLPALLTAVRSLSGSARRWLSSGWLARSSRRELGRRRRRRVPSMRIA